MLSYLWLIEAVFCINELNWQLEFRGMKLLFWLPALGVVFAYWTSSSSTEVVDTIPFDNSCPVIYDNDDHRDMYTDEYLFALASAGSINLKGIITSYSGDNYEYNLFVSGRQQIIDKARQSGLINLPDAIAGPFMPLQRPKSNQIEDTHSLNSVAGQFIVHAAMQASPDKPLVVIAGGQLTAIADAYLQDPLIADRVIVCGIFGTLHETYNAGLDSWAWAIVIRKFRCVSISDSEDGTPYSYVFLHGRPLTGKQRIKQDLENGVIPSTAFYHWMLEKHHPVHPPVYMEKDGDTPAAIPLMRPDYLTGMERWRCTGIDDDGKPVVVPDSDGPLYLIINADPDVATMEFWRAIEESKTWRH